MASSYVRNIDKFKENERRREALRRMIMANGGNTSEYSRLVGVSKASVQKMLNGERRTTDKALAIEQKEAV